MATCSLHLNWPQIGGRGGDTVTMANETKPQKKVWKYILKNRTKTGVAEELCPEQGFSSLQAWTI